MGVVKMQSMKDKLKNLPMTASEDQDIMTDIRYIRKSCALVTDALKKGCDVLQMPNGDIVITEVRTVSFQYTWNETKSKFEKVKSGSRLRRLRSQQKVSDQWSRSQTPEVAAKAGAAMAKAEEKKPAAVRKQEALEDA